jgi:CheY-like chemotaxis protein
MTSDPVMPNLGASQRQATVLLVDDEVLIRLAMSEELRDQGYTVIEAGSADEALSVLRTTVPVDAVVTDLIMPGSLDGGDLVRLIRAEFTWLKIIMLSAHAPEADVRGLLDRYVSKPILPLELVGYLRALVSAPARVEVS